ncbi:MAG: dehydrogenase [candidate division Zixibacteria bacterium RBG_16_53_22]|nr:MAG: dehydrogenase [candidate division Zixibacteria bacterium RBG_16_53_22]
MEKPKFRKVTPEIVDGLRRIVGDQHVLMEKHDIEPYSHDETEDFVFYPEVVVRPIATPDVSEILRLCHENYIPVTSRGGGTGLSGGALPVHGGVILSTERMNRIIEIDRENLMATVQPGVITHNFHQAVEAEGLFYPVDPASKESCTIGGNVAECAGGPRALKYGVTRDYVYGLTCVLPDGRIFKTGGKLLKNVTGYNLTHLIVGSEGTLCVVTEIILKLLPLPQHKRTMLAPFDSLTDAARALTEIFNAKIIPRAAEFIEQKAIKAAEEKLEKPFPHSDRAALLLFEIDGDRADILDEQAEKIGEICVEHGAVDVFVADNPDKQAELWQMRRNIGEAVKSIAIYKEEDTVVPRSRLPELVEKIASISKKHGILTISYGHAGDGNIHVNIIKKNISDDDWNIKVPLVIEELFREVVILGGSISGEHGIGWVQKKYLPLALSPVEIELMRMIKKVFDPRGILNPGKLLPDE